MKKNLEILKIEPKVGKSEKVYWRVQTNEGWMNCWDAKIKEFDACTACVEVEDRPGKNKYTGEDVIYHNITKCYGEAEEMSGIPVIDNTSGTRTYPEDKKPEVVKVPSMSMEEGHSKPNGNGYRTPEQMIMCEMTSCAKDVFCALWANKEEEDRGQPSDLMRTSTELIKQAKEAFE